MLQDKLKALDEITTKLGMEENDIRRNLPGIVRDLRRSLGWSQQRLAYELGVGFTYISHIENSRVYPSRKLLDKLAALELLAVQKKEGVNEQAG